MIPTAVPAQEDVTASRLSCRNAAIHFTKVAGYIQYYGLDNYIGTQYCGVNVTQSGLLAACHLVGVGEMDYALSTGEIVWDGNNVEASEYLSLFSGYDVSRVW